MTASADGRPGLVYVIPHLSDDESEHFAHIPALLSVLGERVDVAAVIERGRAPARLTGVRLILRVPGRSRVGRFLGNLRIVSQCAAAGYTTYFLRYSRLFLIGLIITYPVFRHRVLLWRSGMGDLMAPGQRRSVGDRLDELGNRLLTRFAHRLVTGPESMVAYMSRRWGVPEEKICLLYNDIDTARFAPLPDDERRRVRASHGWGDEEFVILFVHRLSYRRGTRLLAPLFHSICALADTPVRLVVVGDGPDRQWLERAAADARLDGRMQVLGAVPNRDLPPMYGAADCFLMPSYEEGFPRVLLEAMAAALPVVTTDAGGSADVVGVGYPHVLPVGDLDGLGRHLLAVMRMPPAERRALGAGLRSRAHEEFSPHRVAEMLRELL
jgi:glycosyltransferase involved in cell wall biosynthesis